MSAPTIRAVEGRRYASQVLTLTGAPAVTGESGREFHPTAATVVVRTRRLGAPGRLEVTRTVTLDYPLGAELATWSSAPRGSERPLAELPLWVRPIVEPLFPELHYAAPRRVDAP